MLCPQQIVFKIVLGGSIHIIIRTCEFCWECRCAEIENRCVNLTEIDLIQKNLKPLEERKKKLTDKEEIEKINKEIKAIREQIDQPPEIIEIVKKMSQEEIKNLKTYKKKRCASESEVVRVMVVPKKKLKTNRISTFQWKMRIQCEKVKKQKRKKKEKKKLLAELLQCLQMVLLMKIEFDKL